MRIRNKDATMLRFYAMTAPPEELPPGDANDLSNTCNKPASLQFAAELQSTACAAARVHLNHRSSNTVTRNSLHTSELSATLIDHASLRLCL